MVRKLSKTYEEWGLTMNTQKNKYINIAGEVQNLHPKNSDLYKYAKFINTSLIKLVKKITK